MMPEDFQAFYSSDDESGDSSGRDASELAALISLLDDTDSEVFEHVSEKLIGLGPDIIPQLEERWESDLDPLLQGRIESLVHKIQYEDVRGNLRYWVKEDTEDLLEAALILARYAYPTKDINSLRERIGGIRRSIWVELNQYLTPVEKIKQVNSVLFKHLGYKREETAERKPASSYLNILLETRKGNPLGLSMLYLILAQQLELPVYAVNLPLMPVLAFTDGYLHQFGDSVELNDRVEFYIYPYRQGHILTRTNLSEYLRKIDKPLAPEFYAPVSNLDFLRSWGSLQSALYREAGEEERAAEFRELFSLLRKSGGED